MEDLSVKSDVFLSLFEWENNNLPILDEEYFIRYYLPFFLVEDPSPADKENLVVYHMSVAGNPYTKVMVAKDITYRYDEEGVRRVDTYVPLFWIPPLFNSDLDKRLNENGKRNLAGIVSGANVALRNNDPYNQNRFLNALELCVDDKPMFNDEYNNQWKMIFERYNIKPVMKNSSGEIKQLSVSSDIKDIGNIEVVIGDDW